MVSDSMWTTFICLLLLGEGLAQPTCVDGTTELQAYTSSRILSFPEDRSQTYPPDCDKEWLITSNSGMLQLYFVELEIERDSHCDYDSLEIYAGYYNHRRPLRTLCGDLTDQDRNITVSSEAVLLKFHSDESVEEHGFSLFYTSKPGLVIREGEESFHATILNATANEMYLTYPTLTSTYPDNADVTWLITASRPGMTLRIFIVYLEIEEEPDCDYDSLTIYDGSNLDATRLTTLCGKKANFERSYESSGRNLFLHFISDESLNGTGFKLGYLDAVSEPTCNGRVTTNLTASDIEKTMTSPNFPDYYPRACEISWLISSTKQRIRFDIQALDMAGYAECFSDYDYVLFYDGASAGTAILTILCRQLGDHSSPFFSSSKQVLVYFASHGTGGRGFQISFTAADWTNDENDSSNYNSVILAVVIAGVILLLIVTSVVVIVTRRLQKKQQQQRLQQQRDFRSPANPSTTNTAFFSPSLDVYTITPSAPPPPYATLNFAYIHGEPPPSYSEVTQDTIDAMAAPPTSSDMLSNVTDRQTRPPTLSGENGTAAYTEDDVNIYQNGPDLGVNREGVEGNVSQEPNSAQEPHLDYEHGPNQE